MGGIVLFGFFISFGLIRGIRVYSRSLEIQPILVFLLTLLVYAGVIPLFTYFLAGDVYLINFKVTGPQLFSFYTLLCISIFFVYLGWNSTKIGFKLGFKYLLTNKSYKGTFLIIMGCLSYFKVHDLVLINSGENTQHSVGAFDEYFVNGVSFLIMGLALILKQDTMRQKTTFFVFAVIVTLVFVSSGFRYRILVLIIVLITYAGPYLKYRLRLLRSLIFSAVLFLLFGVISVSRSYSSGLNKSKLESVSFEDVIVSAAFEAQVFGYSAVVLDEMENSQHRIGMTPLITAIFMPIPRAVFPSKPDATYLRDIQRLILGTDQIGMAFMYCIEAYLMFGYIGVAIQGIILGFLMRVMWNSIRLSPNKEGYIILGFVNGLVYWYVSRGYLPVMSTAVVYYILLPLLVSKVIQILIPK